MNYKEVSVLLVVISQFGFMLNTVNCQLDFDQAPVSTTTSDSNINTLGKNHLVNVLNFLPQSVRESARSYIASRLRRVAMYPLDDKSATESQNRRKENTLRQPMMGTVPIIPEGQPTPKWIPGELIGNQVTKRQLRQIDESIYGPLKSATMFPSVMSTILVFKKRYDPERLAEVLKFNFGIESEPNGMILEAPIIIPSTL